MDLTNNYDFRKRAEDEFGFIFLTGEACGLGISTLMDLTPEALNLLFWGTNLVPTKKNVNSRQGQIASCLLPYSFVWQLIVNDFYKLADTAVYLTGNEEDNPGWRIEDRLLTDSSYEEITERYGEKFPHFYNVAIRKGEFNRTFPRKNYDSLEVYGLTVEDTDYALPFPTVTYSIAEDHGKALIFQLFGGLVAPTGYFTVPITMVKYLDYYSNCMVFDFVLLKTNGEVRGTASVSIYLDLLNKWRESGELDRSHNSVPYKAENWEGRVVEFKGYPLRNTHGFGGFNHAWGSNKQFYFKPAKTGLDYFNQLENVSLY